MWRARGRHGERKQKGRRRFFQHALSAPNHNVGPVVASRNPNPRLDEARANADVPKPGFAGMAQHGARKGRRRFFQNAEFVTSHIVRPLVVSRPPNPRSEGPGPNSCAAHGNRLEPRSKRGVALFPTCSICTKSQCRVRRCLEASEPEAGAARANAALHKSGFAGMRQPGAGKRRREMGGGGNGKADG